MGKIKAKFRRPSASEQLVLEHFQLQLLTEPAELERCDALIVEHHYLHSATLVGEHLRYVATYKGEWLAVVCFSAGSYHLRYRDQFIGWSSEQRRRRLPLVVNNSRFLVLPEVHYPNLASRLLKQVLARLSADWLARWGHPVVLVETFVDPEWFRGTTYKVSGWSELGPTSGFARHAQDFYEPHERPKQLWVKELIKGACQQLRAEQLPAAWAMVEARAPVRCTTPVRAIGSLLEECRSLPEFRRRQALAYPVAGVFALIVLATLCEVMRGQRDLAAFARKLSQPQLRALGFRCHPRTGRVRCPGESVFQRVLGGLPENQVEAVLLRWLEKILGPVEDTLIAIDGKTLRHAQGTELVSAIGGQTGRWLGTVRVAANSNEIPAAQTLIDRLDLDGKLVVLDALHTQDLTAQKLYFERGADYVMTVKANQKGLYQTLETKLQEQLFSPSAHADDASLSA
ncbi:MAG: ISAs1 family transposase [Chloroflexota bacterium]|nr:ISAs1 family transposase [Chloroflexota bacterium]